ncbi:MAG: AMP-binding protein [Gemmatimonadaceae bacterium]|nr:AMP-binding protein [Gemmatimonadaceae bacterium]
MTHVEGTIPALFSARVAASGAAPALREFDAATLAVVRPLSWGEWYEASLDVAVALVEAGCARGTSCAILAGNTLLWPIAEVGAVLAGMVTVGIYPTASAAQVRALLADADVCVVVVDSALQLAKVREATSGWERPLLVLARDGALVSPGGPGVPLTSPGSALGSAPASSLVRELDWAAFVARGALARRDDPELFLRVRERWDVLSPDETAMLVYTSGSTGLPKGARLSHRYVVESARSIRDTLGLASHDSSLSFLPFSHASERIFGLYTRIACGMLATLVEDPGLVWAASVAAEPTLFGGMPRFFEKVHAGLLAARADAAPADALRWDAAVALGRERARLRQDDAEVPEALERAWREGLSVITPVVARSFGPRLRLATSGGAALPLEVAEYLDACGVTVLGAYGQTEQLCATFNRPHRYRHDSVGYVMPGSMLRIADDGEVQLWRSALTFSGYHRRADETTAAFTDDGRWLRTGDLGAIDGAGFLRLTGRRKELIALSNGKKVAPLPLEARLADGAFVAHAMVFGEGRPYLVALVSLRWPLVERWQRARGIEGDAALLVRHPALVREVQDVVARANAEVSRPEQVRKFTILAHDLTEAAGEVTPTHKFRRTVVAEHYAVEIDALYRETA